MPEFLPLKYIGRDEDAIAQAISAYETFPAFVYVMDAGYGIAVCEMGILIRRTECAVYWIARIICLQEASGTNKVHDKDSPVDIGSRKNSMKT